MLKVKRVARAAALLVVAAGVFLGAVEAQAGGRAGGSHRGGSYNGGGSGNQGGGSSVYYRPGGFGLAYYPKPWISGSPGHGGGSVRSASWFCRTCSAYHVGRCPRR